MCSARQITRTARLSFSATGKFRELTLLFFPLLSVSFCNYLFLLVEKLFLARLSFVSMEAAVNVSYACHIFQGTTVALAMMAQVFVGRWYGAREFSLIGPGIWQFIWFSFLSMVITVPMSLAYGAWYFRGTDIEVLGLPYFYFLVGFNFLYPLSAVLSCFFLGQGRTRFVLLANLFAQLLKIGLAYLLIFGIEGWLPSLGILGGAISTVCAQGLFCVLLGSVFLGRASREMFHSHRWFFSLSFFMECMYPGLLRAVNRILNFTSWASIAHLMLAKGGDYLLVLSIGGVLSLFLPFLAEAVCQAQTAIVSYLMGSNRFIHLWTSVRSGFGLVLILSLIMGIPFIGFPLKTFGWLFPDIILNPASIQKVFFGVWLSFTFVTVTSIPLSFVLSAKDMVFSCIMGLVNWLNGFLLMYVALEKIGITHEYFWIALSLMHGSTFLVYCWRMRHIINRSLVQTPVPVAVT